MRISKPNSVRHLAFQKGQFATHRRTEFKWRTAGELSIEIPSNRLITHSLPVRHPLFRVSGATSKQSQFASVSPLYKWRTGELMLRKSQFGGRQV